MSLWSFVSVHAKIFTFPAFLPHKLEGWACSGRRCPPPGEQVSEVTIPQSSRAAASVSGRSHGGFLSSAGYPCTCVTSVKRLCFPEFPPVRTFSRFLFGQCCGF